MFDSRSPWYSGGTNSRSDLEAGSSLSLLHSIYGSQISQLPFSDCDSDVDLLATQSDYLPTNRRSSSPALPQRRLARPKSSPSCVTAAREQQRRQLSTDGARVGRPGSAMPRQRPGTALGRTRITRGKPIGAVGSRVQRPTSAVSSHFAGGGGANLRRIRPKTAMGFVSIQSLNVTIHYTGSHITATPVFVQYLQHSSSSSSSTMLVDLEEEEEEDNQLAPIIRDTPPVCS